MIQRKGTYQQWFDANPTLNSGEIGFESDTGKFKIGDGNTNWNNLTYFVDEDQVTIMTQGYATEEYVDNAVSGVEVDLSTAAGNALDWNAGTSQLDVNVTSVINAIPSGTFAVPGDIPSLTGYATESYVTTAIGNVIDSAPGALNTLNELAAAINDDASYAATITNALSEKAPLTSPTFTGTVDFTGATVTGIPTTSTATPTTLGTVYGLTDTDGNVALGRFSSLTGGNWNIAIGDNAMKNNTNGSNNVSVGEASMENFLTGDSNTAVGDYSLNNIEDSQDNTAIGGGALIRLWSGYKNTALGSQAGTRVGGFSGSNNLLLGADSSPSSGTVSNEVTIGNQDITRFRIPGLSVDWSTSAYGRATYASTSAPSGGNDGDLWIVYS